MFEKVQAAVEGYKRAWPGGAVPPRYKDAVEVLRHGKPIVLAPVNDVSGLRSQRALRAERF